MGCTALVFLVLSVMVPQLRVSSAAYDDIPPMFTSDGQPPRSFLVNLQMDGNNLVLPCEVTGTPNITVSWFREDSTDPISQAVLADGERDCTLSVRVTNVTAPPEGINYYCIATNTVRSTMAPGSTITAVVRSRNVSVSNSYFDSREAVVATIENTVVALECAFNPRNPAPNITWFANGMRIAETSRIHFVEGGRYLVIQDLTADDRMMSYHCEVNQNGMSIRAPTTYTLNTDIPEGLTVYFNQTTISGTVNQPVDLVFAASARDSLGIVPVRISCPRDNPLVTFRQDVVTTIPATLTEAAMNESQVEFTCTIRTTEGPLLSKIVMATIILPKVGPPPVNITTPLPDDPTLTDRDRLVGGGPVEYPCEASGSPAPTITWYYNGAVVQSGSGGVVVGGDGTLTILTPQVSHSGIYQCFARNQFSDDSRAWILEVKGPVIQIIDCESDFPIVKHNQNNLLLPPLETTNLGITFTVETTFVGVPSRDDFCPNVQWQINGTDIVNDTVYIVSNPCGGIRENERIHLFTLTIATFTLDTIGEYSLSSQDAGVSKQLVVTFQECSKSGPDEPVSDGSRVDIRCLCRDIIPANVSWFKDGRSLDDADRTQTSQVMNNVFVLSIEPVRIMDRGRYTCTIATGAGQYSGDITVEVLQLENNSETTIIGGDVELVFIGVEISVVVIFKVL